MGDRLILDGNARPQIVGVLTKMPAAGFGATPAALVWAHPTAEVWTDEPLDSRLS